jgi:[ribosomal protein S5]-alanine N-acetyltransferase
MRSIEDICTARLDLIALTPECALSEQAADGRLGELTRAKVPAAWPPEHWEPHVFVWVLKRFAEHPEEIGWGRLMALRELDGSRTLIGTLGGHRKAEAWEECEVGWGLLPEFQGLGYATEGALAFIAWVLRDATVKVISAQTFPSLPASIRVMEKCGMRFEGPGDDEGTVRYRVDR